MINYFHQDSEVCFNERFGCVYTGTKKKIWSSKWGFKSDTYLYLDLRLNTHVNLPLWIPRQEQHVHSKIAF